MEREKFGSRIGFIFVAAGCAVGLGNVWKFPYLCGQNGGAAFIVIYLLCLVLLALPILVGEIAIGRASQKSIAKAFQVLEPKGTRWHLTSYMCMAGTYVLMMFYTGVCGWMLLYFMKYVFGDFSAPNMTSDVIASQFTGMLASPVPMILATIIVILAAFSVCSLGVQKGVEKVTKWMMGGLLVLIVALAINSVMLPGAEKGVEFYLVPNFDTLMERGVGKVLFDAMSQAFFTLSIGIGAMAIFGSYLDKKRSLAGEGMMITILDTIVAVLAGLIIIPACFAFDIEPGAGPSLVFITMPNVFYQMPGGTIWGALFFLFLVFAALSTVIAVFENIIADVVELFGVTRKKAIGVNIIVLSLTSIPCILGFNLWSGFEPLGPGSNVMDLEDFLVSNNFLPLGALLFLMFCTRKNGWNWTKFVDEANQGEGLKVPGNIRGFLNYVAPSLVIIIYLKGYYDKFIEMGTGYLVCWMLVAVLFLGVVAYISFSRPKPTASLPKDEA